MARPGQAIAATLSRILLNIYPKKDVTLGTMPLSPQKNIGSEGVASITLRKTGPRKHPETIRRAGRAKRAYVYGEGVVKAEAVNLLCSSIICCYSVFCISDWPDLGLDIQDGCQAGMNGSLVHPQRGYAT
jgi:hypothetical protein